MTIKEIARQAGLTRSTVYCAIYRRELLADKFGHDSWHVTKDDLVSWLTVRRTRLGLPVEGHVWLVELTTGQDRSAIVAHVLDNPDLYPQTRPPWKKPSYADYYKRPEIIARNKAKRDRPDVKALLKARREQPEAKAKRRAYLQEYRHRPGVIARRREAYRRKKENALIEKAQDATA